MNDARSYPITNLMFVLFTLKGYLVQLVHRVYSVYSVFEVLRYPRKDVPSELTQ